jgi:cytoskeletal protein CcmA (bactofilin family)
MSPTTVATYVSVINFQGPNITLAGNLNMYSWVVSGGKNQLAYVYHTAGKLSLTGTTAATTPGTGGKGYINAYQSNTGPSTQNRYTTGSGAATVEFYHVGDVPIYAQQGNINTPLFNTQGTTVIYKAGTTGTSTIYGSTYYNLYLQNNSGYTTSDVVTINNQFDMVAGNLSIPYNFTLDASNNGTSFTTMNISSGSGIQSSGGTFGLNTDTYINYSGSVSAAGIELVIPASSPATNTKIKTLSITCPSFNLGTGSALYIKDSVVINSSNFTCDQTLITSKAITLSGNSSTYNCNLIATVPTVVGGQTIYLNGNLIVNGTSTINGNIIAETTLNGASTINGTLNSNTLTVNASSTINGAITTSILNANASLTLNNEQQISDSLNLAANFSNDNNVFVPNLSVTNNSTLTPTGIGKIEVSNVLAVTSGKVLNANGDLTIVSDGNGTARVAQVDSGAIIGNVTVERYLKNTKRCWRLLTTPLQGTTNNSIFYNWQNNGAQINGDTPNGTGTDVWGPVNTYDPSTNGLYYVPVSTHNFRKYNNGWTSVSDTKNEPLFSSTKNNAFLAFIIKPAGQAVGVGLGSNGENVATSGQATTVLSAQGQLLTYTISDTNYHLIGNPYASSIDFVNLISSAGANGGTISPKIWVIDPAVSQYGNYVTWDPVNHWNDPNAQNAINNTTTIQSGQAFFVKGLSGASSQTFSIQESNKVSSSSFNVLGKAQNTDYERIRATVSKIESGVDIHKDACVVAFYQGASNQVDENDVQKFTNPAETLSLLNGTTTLSSEHRAPIVDGDILFIKLSQAVTSSYKLKIYTENFTFTGTAYLYDLFLGTNVILPLDGSVFEYPFDVTSNVSSQGTRFKIVFTSALSTVKIDNDFNIVVYPNPATKANGINLNLGTLEYGNYNYKIINVLGQEIQKGTFDKQQLNQDVAINFNNSFKEGWYAIQILTKNSTIYTLPILIK